MESAECPQTAPPRHAGNDRADGTEVNDRSWHVLMQSLRRIRKSRDSIRLKHFAC